MDIIEILKEDKYRSKPEVNMQEDKIRIIFTCEIWVWRRLKKVLSNNSYILKGLKKR